MPEPRRRTSGSTMLIAAGAISVLMAIPSLLMLSEVGGRTGLGEHPLFDILFGVYLVANVCPLAAGIVTIVLARSLNRTRYLALAITLTAASLLATMVTFPVPSAHPPSACVPLIVSAVALALTGRLNPSVATTIGARGGEFTVPVQPAGPPAPPAGPGSAPGGWAAWPAGHAGGLEGERARPRAVPTPEGPGPEGGVRLRPAAPGPPRDGA